MWNEMEENGQYRIDCRLSGERTMEENVNVMIEFATDIRKEQVGDAKVRNKHEGYGFLADAHQNVIKAMKSLKDGMGDLLDCLPMTDSVAIDKTESVANALADVILHATKMAAEAKRVSNDLYKENWNPTPIEQALAGDEGFEDPEETEKEEEEDGED
jgi:CHAD domain-containing protein